MSANNLLTQCHAVHGFRMWLASLPSNSDAIRREFADELFHVLSIYESELDRVINGEPATSEWYCLIIITSQLLKLLQDSLLNESNPELRAYRTTDELTIVREMTADFLSEAGEQFARSEHEMSSYLERPIFPIVFDKLIRLTA
jgi:hypothetical protein